VKKASLDDLRALSFLPDAVAEAIHEKFHGAAGGPPVPDDATKDDA